MLCENCGKNHATTRIRTIVNGTLYEKNLCDYCAALSGYSKNSGDTLSQMLFSMFDNTAVSPPKKPTTRCECCGSTFDAIAKSGKCGCPKCYQVFYNDLLPYIKRVHGSTRHTGKIPSKLSFAVDTQEQTVEQLRSQLAELVREERYEDAAILRDKIKKLEAQS